MTGQLVLDLGHPTALGRDDFLVAPPNAEAVAWLERWPNWPAHALALFGPDGSGKSHLLAAFTRERPPATLLRAADLMADRVGDLVAGARIVAIDDLDGLADEVAAFHLWNLTKESGRFLLLAGRSAPARLNVGLPDLASRLASVPAIAIGAPDDALLSAVLVKLFADRQVTAAAGVVPFVLGRVPRSFAAIGRVAEALDRAALASGRAITVALARRVIEATASWEDEHGSGNQG